MIAVIGLLGHANRRDIRLSSKMRNDRICRGGCIDEVDDLVVQATQLDPDVETQLRAADLTYDHVGRTSGVLPDGYGHLNRRMIIGLGMARFADASRALFGWQMHLRSGVRVATSSPSVKDDAVVMLGIGGGPFRLNAPCRVVYIIDEPNRQGFAYGTLPGHPDQVKRRLSSSAQTMTPSPLTSQLSQGPPRIWPSWPVRSAD